jgi:hypothetical protein
MGPVGRLGKEELWVRFKECNLTAGSEPFGREKCFEGSKLK